MANDKKRLGRTYIPLFLISGIMAVMIGMSVKTPMWMDEYVFYRLSGELPKYSTTADWFFVDRPAVLHPTLNWDEYPNFDRNAALRLDYDTPVYPHTPLMPLLMSPLVKGLNWAADEGWIPHIEAQPGAGGTEVNNVGQLVNSGHAEVMTNILRVIPMVLFAISMWLIVKIMRQKVGIAVYFFAVPVAVSIGALTGAYLFYWDVFMMFFFVLTLYLMEFHPKSKWKYVAAALMINTKMFIPFMMLVPLVLKAGLDGKSWKPAFKMALTGLAIVPFYIITIIVTHDPLYVFTHYLNQMGTHNFIYTLWTPHDILYTYVMPNMSSFLWWVYLASTVPVLWFWKKYPVYATAYLMTSFYAWGMGLGLTHFSTLLYTAALAAPLVAKEFRLVERLRQGWRTPKIERVS